MTQPRQIVPLFLLALLLLTGSVFADQDNARALAIRTSIEHAVSARTQDQQQAAFDEIAALGCRAVPEIVAVMDDSRPLPIAYIRLKNDNPDAFEAFRQYGPQTVTDAMAAILNHLTGRSFGFIYNGATPDERRKAVDGWREYIRRKPTRSLCR
jgi:hypothetical protein